KPPYSYATLIAHAILSSKEKKMTLYEIYQWISEHYPCYSMKDHRWQNSIRHNLSLQKAFVKLERKVASTSSGKGCFWTVLPDHEQQFIDNLVKR
ncbi:fork head transcription factor, partial [Backusella circina FSU 941]